VYGLWLLEELAEHGHRLSPGTLYPILKRMERNGWLRSTSARPANARKNYRITAAGRRVLKQLRSDVDELHRELVLGIEPEPAADRRRRRRA
jgi:DNA-binding PadR family transcriptional regulator